MQLVTAFAVWKEVQIAGLGVDGVLYLKGCQQYDLPVEPLLQSIDVVSYAIELSNTLNPQNLPESLFYLVLFEFLKGLVV